jgi:hypothetical protein
MTTIANIKRTKKFKALLAVGLDEDTALKHLGHRVADPTTAAIAELVAAGFTEVQAKSIVGGSAAPTEPAKAAASKVLTSKEHGEVLVEERGLAFARGRTYGNTNTAEAIVRVLKTGKPEIIQSSGVGRVAAVLIYREDSGDFALQNLIPSES